MKVFLAGGTGFIGGHLLDGLVARGHEVTALARPAAPPSSLSGVRWLQGEWRKPEDWLEHLHGHDAAVHAVGIIRETKESSFDMVQREIPVRLQEAARQAGVESFIQISALGATDGAPTPFLRTKREADLALEVSGLRHLILRPSIVFGPGDHSMAFFERLARMPLTPLPEGGRMRIQPVHVDDVVRAALDWLGSDRRSAAYDVGGGEALTLHDALHLLRGRPLRSLSVPAWAMGLAAATTDLIGAGPITRDELRMLRMGSVCDNKAFIRAFGFEPRAFSNALALRHTR